MGAGHIRKGDIVEVISGSHSGKRGRVLQMLPRKSRAIVEGVALVKKHERKTRDNPEGAIVEREGSVHISNLKRVEKREATPKPDETKQEESAQE